MSEQNDGAWTDGPIIEPKSEQVDSAQGALLSAVEMLLKEQRRARRWGVVFKSLFFLLAFGIVALVVWDESDTEADNGGSSYTALVELEGVIAAGAEANADDIAKGLRRAFADSGAKGVVLRINSPGGSPVQSAQINEEIVRLRALHPEKPLYVVVTDVCASGGYYVAAAADKIFVNRSSLVGSIGVLFNSFGFVDAMEKLGVERRLLTAGEHKGLLDPFSPMREIDQAHLQSVLDSLHQEFINVVKSGRGDRLVDDPKLFSGLIWGGEEAVQLGLADGFGSARSVARDLIGAETLRDFTPREEYWQRVARQLGSSFADRVATLMGWSVLPR
jgi:protease-4